MDDLSKMMDYLTKISTARLRIRLRWIEEFHKEHQGDTRITRNFFTDADGRTKANVVIPLVRENKEHQGDTRRNFFY